MKHRQVACSTVSWEVSFFRHCFFLLYLVSSELILQTWKTMGSSFKNRVTLVKSKIAWQMEVLTMNDSLTVFLFAKNVDLSDTYATEFWEIFFNGLFTRTTELVSNILTSRGGIPMWKRQGKLLEILKTPKETNQVLTQAFCDAQKILQILKCNLSFFIYLRATLVY